MPRERRARRRQSSAPETGTEHGKIADLVREMLREMGEDPEREGLQRTPERFEKALRFLTSGYQQDPRNC